MINFTNCKELINTYGGSEKKKRIVYNNEIYLLKFPDPIREKNNELSYMNNQFSEYIGCHIFESVGICTQKTILGKYIESNGNAKIVVACKDFTVQNDDTKIIFSNANQLANSATESDKKYKLSIEDVNDLIDNVSIISNKETIKNTFWDVFVVDSLISNPDRHMDNWGVIYKNGKIEFAPVYDCGSCLFAIIDNTIVDNLLLDPIAFKNKVFNASSCYSYKGKRIQYGSFYKNPPDALISAMKRIIPLINLDNITKIIMNTDELPANKKKFYLKVIEFNYNEILFPSLIRELKKENKKKFNVKPISIHDHSEMFQETIKYLYNSKEKELDLTMDDIHSLVEVGIYNKNPNYMKDFIDDCDKYGIEKEWNEEDQQYVFHLNKDLLNQFDLSSFDQTINDDAGIEVQSISKNKGISK